MTMIGISGLGFLTVFLLREIPLTRSPDQIYGLVEGKHVASGESLEVKA